MMMVLLTVNLVTRHFTKGELGFKNAFWDFNLVFSGIFGC